MYTTGDLGVKRVAQTLVCVLEKAYQRVINFEALLTQTEVCATK